MVDAYNKDLETPYTDPNTGKQFKYKMLPPPDLEEVDDSKIIKNNKTPDEISKEIQKLLDLYNGGDQKIDILQRELLSLRKDLEYLSGSSSPDDIIKNIPRVKSLINAKTNELN